MDAYFRTLVCLCGLSFIFGDPTGCTYDASEILFTCNARLWTLPLVFSTFTSAQPQRLMLKDVDGELASSAPNGPTFSGFSSINTATFDSNYAPALYIMCFYGGNLILYKDAFTDFSYVEELKIINCDILSLPVQVFAHFGDVNLLHIEGGSISNMVADSLKGLNVAKMSTVPVPLGEFAIKNSQLTSGALPYGVLFNIANIERVIIENAHLNTLESDMLYALPKLNYISLNYNPFTSVPNNVFANTHALSTVEMYGINWACSCDNLWFIDHLVDNNITLNGDIVCNSPVDYQNKRAKKYQLEKCPLDGVCGSITGIASGDRCLSVFTIISYILMIIILVITCVAFGLIIHTMRQVKNCYYGGDHVKPNFTLGRRPDGTIFKRSSKPWATDEAPELPKKKALATPSVT